MYVALECLVGYLDVEFVSVTPFSVTYVYIYIYIFVWKEDAGMCSVSSEKSEQIFHYRHRLAKLLTCDS